MVLRRLLLLLIWLAPAFGRHLPVHVFTAAEGLPRNSVGCLVPGIGGVMWICTSEGLVRFDGHGFRVFGVESGLPSQTVLNLLPAKSGGYWVVTDKGICRLGPRAKIGETCALLQNDKPQSTWAGTILE